MIIHQYIKFPIIYSFLRCEIMLSFPTSTQYLFSPIISKIMCHELGCLPVSKLCGLPSPSDLLESDGTPKDANHRLLEQLPELLTQLEWMAVAMKNQRYVRILVFVYLSTGGWFCVIAYYYLSPCCELLLSIHAEKRLALSKMIESPQMFKSLYLE